MQKLSRLRGLGRARRLDLAKEFFDKTDDTRLQDNRDGPVRIYSGFIPNGLSLGHCIGFRKSS